MRLVARWLMLPVSDKYLVLQVAGIMLLIRMGLRLRPMTTVKHVLVWKDGASRSSAPGSSQERNRVVWAVSALGSHLLGDGPCLTQALTTHLLLKRRGYPAQVYVGVAKDERERLIAHAWVESDGIVVIGGPKQEIERYTRLPVIERLWR